MSKIYQSGFTVLRPIVTDDNQDLIYDQLQKRKAKFFKKVNKLNLTKGERLKVGDDYYLNHIDDLEDIIGDEAFASFLNSEAEIQIGNMAEVVDQMITIIHKL